MKRLVTAALLLLAVPSHVEAQSARVIKFQDLDRLLHSQSDTTYVVNFWATWCGPCVKELPNFQTIASKHSNEKLKVIFISLDFKKNLTTALNPFLKRHHVSEDVYLLDETDYNSWIDKVDSSWEGSLPATLIFNNAYAIRKFYPREFTGSELEAVVDDFRPMTPILPKHE